MHISITSTLRRMITPDEPDREQCDREAEQHLHLIHAVLRLTCTTQIAATIAASSSTDVSSNSSQYSLRNAAENCLQP